MTDTIHPAWLRPMPKYWWDFSDRDAEILDEPIRPGRLTNTGEIECMFCGKMFEPKGINGHLRVRCYDPECERARKRRNARLSARRAAARKRAQQA